MHVYVCIYVCVRMYVEQQSKDQIITVIKLRPDKSQKINCKCIDQVIRFFDRGLLR